MLRLFFLSMAVLIFSSCQKNDLREHIQEALAFDGDFYFMQNDTLYRGVTIFNTEDLHAAAIDARFETILMYLDEDIRSGSDPIEGYIFDISNMTITTKKRLLRLHLRLEPINYTSITVKEGGLYLIILKLPITYLESYQDSLIVLKSNKI